MENSFTISLDNLDDENKLFPPLRLGHCMACVGNYVIVYGGASIASVIRDDLWVLDTTTSIWKRYDLPSCVERRCLASAICTFEDNVYIFGGTDVPEGDRISNILLSYHVIQNRWETLYDPENSNEDNDVPKMYNASIHYHDNYIWVIAGTNGDHFLGTILRFCLRNHTWSQVETFGMVKTPISLGNCTLFENKFYYFNNLDLSPIAFSRIRVFDLVSQNWEDMPTKSSTNTFPDNRIGESIVLCDHYVYLVGGRRPNMVHNGKKFEECFSISVFLENIWRIDLKTLEWEKTDLILKPGVSYHKNAFVTPDVLYIFGGINSDMCMVTGIKALKVTDASKVCKNLPE
ncbi:Kelch domain-containing protein 10 [Thelohanellus kitauei]|uniref:Kelch domain-containing protein 10 n=1 Tax=Thelohanellus kitauei TaxID=669202 RepID=A0A0C2JV13_THEKT|nr:Kelch domain-containing protein 10 [Thelohanellus kitauei]